MALTTIPLPYGLRDVKIYPIDSSGTVGSAIDLPNSRTFSFEENEDFEELRGDDKVVATRGQGPTVAWELESGGISLEAYAAMSGADVVESGTTPNQIKTLTKLSTQSRPRFKVRGQAISESGGDFHVVLYNCKATESLSGELSDGAFWLSSGSGTAIGDPTNDKVYDFVQNETATAIT
jgi:hypothetical protein